MKRTHSSSGLRPQQFNRTFTWFDPASSHRLPRSLMIVLALSAALGFVDYALFSVLPVKIAAASTAPPPCTPPTTLIISEFRLRGAAGANDEFIEFYNSSDSQITVCTADQSSGWALAARNANATAVSTVVVIPNGTTIPARGHLLAVNNGSNGYSLSNHPAASGTTATGDLSYATDIEDNSGIALFVTSNPANFTTANRLDSAGFSGASGAIADLYREGSGLTPIGSADGNFTFVRKMMAPSAGLPQDTGVNTSDFLFIAADGGTYGGIEASLGSPGPENLTSPIQRNASFGVTLLDPTVGSSVSPNRVRDLTPSQENPNGTLSIRRHVTNYSGANATRLRFRIVDITTFRPSGGLADMRARTSNAIQVTVQGVVRTVQGTTVEQPPSLCCGGGYNSTMSVGMVSLAQPLAPNASLDVQFVLGVATPGSFKFLINVEALTDTAEVRLDPMNQTGGGNEDPLSRNSGWSIPLVSLPGRSGLDLSLSLAYNSLATWTKKNSSIFFNEDRDFLHRGFGSAFQS